MLEFDVKIEGINALTQFLNKELPNRIDAESRKLLKKIGERIVKRAKALSPKKSGVLERSITFKLGVMTGGNQVIVFVPSSSGSSSYAGYMHEGHYRLGAISRMKSGAGRKFIERAVKENSARAIRMYNDMLEKIGKEESAK